MKRAARPAKRSANLRAAFLLAATLLLGGCAGPGGLFGLGDNAPLFPSSGLSAQRAGESVVPGRSTRADVLAALGKARVIHFESGYEVWVYRGRAADAALPGKTEFIVLFAADGIARKTRLRLPAKDDQD